MKKGFFRKRKEIKGAFDVITAGYAHGWAYNPAQADQPLTIEIFQSTQVLAVGTADQLRQDLVDQGVGNGCYGFKIPLDISQIDSSLPVQARILGSTTLIPGSIESLPPVEQVQPSTNTALKGFFHGLADGKAQGWAYFPASPHQFLTIEILLGDTVIAKGVADKFREDLKKQGFDTGYYGFSIQVDSPENIGPELKARVAGTGILLKRLEPIRKNSQTPSVKREAVNPPADLPIKGFYNGITDGQVTGWVFSPAKMNQPLEIEVVLGDKVIAQKMANEFRQDLKDKNFGNGCYGFSISVPQIHDAQLLWVRESSTGKGLLCPTTLKMPESVPRIPTDQATHLLETSLAAQETTKSAIDKSISQCKILCQCLNTGTWGLAFHILNELQNKHQVIPVLSCLSGELFLLTQNGEQALKAFTSALEQDPNLFWGHAGVAEAHCLLGSPDSAIDAFRIAANLQPHNIQIKKRLETLLLRALPNLYQQKKSAQGKQAAHALLARYAIDFFNYKPLIDTILSILSQEHNESPLPGYEEIIQATATQQLLQAIIEEIEADSPLQDAH